MSLTPIPAAVSTTGLTGLISAKYMAIFAVFIAVWNKIKFVFSKITSLIIVRIQVDDWSLTQAISILLNKEFSCSPLGKKSYTGQNEYVRPEKRNILVGFELIPNEPTIWWRNKRPLIVAANGDHSVSLTFLRGVYNRNKWITEAIDKFNKEQNNDEESDWKAYDRFYISRKSGSSRGMLASAVGFHRTIGITTEAYLRAPRV